MLILQEKLLRKVPPEQMDEMLAEGWRHFGTHFFRYNIALNKDGMHDVIPLRVRLKDHNHSKSQRKTLRKGGQFSFHFSKVEVTEEMEALFGLHSLKFEADRPRSVWEIISREPNVPCANKQLSVYDGGRLIAVSFMDVTPKAISSIYGFYDLNYKDFRLGILTMLQEIEFAKAAEKQYYYHGYCFAEPSFYDYKKRFSALEGYDWDGGWYDLPNS